MWQAPDADTAMALASAQALEGDELTGDPLPFAECFHLFVPPAHGVEVFSLLRHSNLGGDAYLARFLDTGGEHRRHA